MFLEIVPADCFLLRMRVKADQQQSITLFPVRMRIPYDFNAVAAGEIFNEIAVRRFAIKLNIDNGV